MENYLLAALILNGSKLLNGKHTAYVEAYVFLKIISCINVPDIDSSRACFRQNYAMKIVYWESIPV